MGTASVFVCFISLGILFQLISIFAFMATSMTEVSPVEGIYQIIIGVFVGIGSALFYCLAEKLNEKWGARSVFRNSFWNTIFSWLGGFLGNLYLGDVVQNYHFRWRILQKF